MFRVNSVTKIFLFLSLVSLLLWVLYWFRPSYDHFLNAVAGIPDSYISNLGLVYWFGHLGLNARFLCSVFGLAGLIFFWHSRSFGKTRFLFGIAVFFEGLYLVFQVPFVWNLAGRGVPFLTVSYAVQASMGPLLFLLGLNIWKFKSNNEAKFWFWAGLGLLGYFVALWANAVLRWFDMLWTEGFSFFINGVRVLGFLNACILMSLGVVFSSFGFIYFRRKLVDEGLKWIGLSLMVVGLQYALYLVYSYFVGALAYTLLIDIWATPFLGLGVALLKYRKFREVFVNRRLPF